MDNVFLETSSNFTDAFRILYLTYAIKKLKASR